MAGMAMAQQGGADAEGGVELTEKQLQEKAAKAAKLISAEEALISQWLKTEDLISKELADWKASKGLLQNTLEVHRKELVLLAEEMQKLGEDGSSVEEKYTEAKAEFKKSQTALKKMVEYLESLRPRFESLVKRYPSFLSKSLKGEIAYLSEPINEKNYPSGLKAMIKVLQEGEKFNSSFDLREHLIALKGEEYSAQVMYFGFSCAFFKAGEKVGIGKPAKDGWLFQERPEIKEQLEHGFAVKKGEKPSSFFELPLQLQQGGGQP